MTRRCSHCGHNGHNARTCPDRERVDRGVRLFGVRLTANDSTAAANMRKSQSLGNLNHYASSNNPPSPPELSEIGGATDGYVSDGLVQTSNNARERKKGVPWTEDEHRFFLMGLRKLGKGDWRGISRNYVQTRTPTQVASHAQKYFIRQSNMHKRKRRSSLFDIVSDNPRPVGEDVRSKSPDISTVNQLSLGSGAMFVDSQGEQGVPRNMEVYHPPVVSVCGVPPRPFPIAPHFHPQQPVPVAVPVPPVTVLAGLSPPDQASESAVTFNGEVTVIPKSVVNPPSGPLVAFSGMSDHIFPVQVWGLGVPQCVKPSNPPASGSRVLKPTAQPAKTDPEGTEMAKLTLGPSPSAESSNLTSKLLDQHPTRTSAFQMKVPFSSSSHVPSTISVV